MDFDFVFVDGVTALAEAQVSATLDRITPLSANRIGPLLEFEYLRRQPRQRHLPAATGLTDAPVAAYVVQTLQANTPLTATTITARNLEIARLPHSLAQNALWAAFLRRLVNASKSAGFDDLTSKGLAGAFGELADNAIDHSERVESATIAYAWQPGMMEMIIADAGIGIRRSLTKNPKHAGILDDQVALEQALTMGVTRYPDGGGHGTGFKTVFDALASLGGLLRFRSGDAVLLLEGSDLGHVKRKLLQRNNFQGFVAAIYCTTQLFT